MTTNRIVLEQFTTEIAPPMTMDLDIAEAGGLMSASAANYDHGLTLGDETELDIPPMDDPLIRPAPQEDDPDAEERERLKDDLTESCTRLSSLIAEIETDRDRHLQATTTAAANHVAMVGGELLAHVINAGFLTEIAATIAELSGRHPGEHSEINVAPDDHEPLAELIRGLMPEGQITLRSDPSLAAGQARMHWPDGGAEFDAEKISERARPMISNRLEQFSPGATQ